MFSCRRTRKAKVIEEREVKTDEAKSEKTEQDGVSSLDRMTYRQDVRDHFFHCSWWEGNAQMEMMSGGGREWVRRGLMHV